MHHYYVVLSVNETCNLKTAVERSKIQANKDKVEWEQRLKRLDDHCSRHWYKRVGDTPMDGNCQFDVVAQQVMNYSSKTLREAVVNHMRANPIKVRKKHNFYRKKVNAIISFCYG